MKFGTEVGHCIEKWFLNKPIDDDISKRAVKCVKKWTDFIEPHFDKTLWTPEKKVEFKIHPKLNNFVGYIDLWARIGDTEYAYDIKTAKRAINTWKKTDIFYGLNQSDVIQDWQLMSYQKGMELDSIARPAVHRVSGHIQFIKNVENFKDKNIVTRQVEDYVSLDQMNMVVRAIEHEADNLYDTLVVYHEKGWDGVIKKFKCKTLKELAEKSGEKKWYGKEGEFWKFAKGIETLEDLKERYKNVNRGFRK